MWFIHGKKYDLTKFLDSHPGGKVILESCKGDTDCTAAFESYHAMCDMKKIKSIMGKYETGVSKINPVHTFADGEFYRTVQQRVRTYFGKDTDRQDHQTIDYHSNSFWVIKSIFTFFVYMITFYIAFYSDLEFTIKLLFGVLSGLIVVQLGFIVLHDASHCAVSKTSIINDTLSRITNAILLWDHRMWMTHHVYRHHSFTSDPVLDPDTMHLRPFVMKHEGDNESKFIQWLRQYPEITTIISTIFFPGVCVGQGLVYHFVWRTRKYLWGMKLPDTYKPSELEILIKLFILCSFYNSGSLSIMMIYMIACNISYFIAIMPDHDMIQTAKHKILSSSNDPVDWGEAQVKNSGNFATNSVFLTEMYGGINYQIEHHLFPSISHVHYKTISHIIKQTCKEFSVPYVESKTLIEALSSVFENFGSLGTKRKAKSC